MRGGANPHSVYPLKTTTINAGVGLTGGGDLSVNRTLGLANTSVTAGTYGTATQSPSITVDAQGRVTSASINPLTPDWNNVTNFSSGAVSLPVASGWAAYPGWPPSHRKDGNRVYLSGLVQRTGSTETAIANLPVNYRPSVARCSLGVIWEFASADASWCIITIYTNGTVSLTQPVSSGPIFWISLDNVGFFL